MMHPFFQKGVMRKRPGKPLKFYLKLMRHPGTPESTGRGIAIGLFTAFVIPVGHMLAAFLLAIPARGARGAAVIATWIINPLTLPFIWPAQCYLGSYLIGRPLSYALIKRLISNVINEPSLQTARALSGELILSFFAGGLLLGTLTALPGYFLTARMVRRHRVRLAERKNVRKSRWKNKESLK
jgi:uncharacterized protein (DUF2062 family)